MRLGDAPGRHAVRHGRVACPARGLAHRVLAPYDRADLTCGWGRLWRWPGLSVTAWPCRVTVPPAVTGARQQGAPAWPLRPRPRGGVWHGSPGRTQHGEREPGARGWWTSHVRRRCPVQRHPVGVSHMRRGCGARAVRLWGMWTASPPCVGGAAPYRPFSACARVSLACPGGSRGSAAPPRQACRWRALEAGLCVCAEVACRQGSLGTSQDVAGPEAGAQRGPTKQWSRPRQWELCGTWVPYMARRLTAGVGLLRATLTGKRYERKECGSWHLSNCLRCSLSSS